MSLLEAFILGLIQGLSEFLPVSSSGHIELGKALFGIEIKDDVSFTIILHGATVLSTIVVLHKEIWALLKALFTFKWNEEVQYIAMLALSAVPVVIVGLLFKDEIEALFDGNIVVVGTMLIITSLLLGFTYFSKKNEKGISYLVAIIIGITQTVAVLPGLSRSGTTIATALLLGVKREVATKFSFLMVLVPIIGANVKDIADGNLTTGGLDITTIAVGFLTSFVVGFIACKWMIKIVNKGKLIYFAIYCLLAGITAIVLA